MSALLGTALGATTAAGLLLAASGTPRAGGTVAELAESGSQFRYASRRCFTSRTVTTSSPIRYRIR
jgi:hypothetical protein